MVKISENISVNVGEDITLMCEADGYPPPFISWLHDLGPLYDSPRYALDTYYGYGTLRINNAQVSDSGTYNCVIITGLYGLTLVQPAISVTVDNGKLTFVRLN